MLALRDLGEKRERGEKGKNKYEKQEVLFMGEDCEHNDLLHWKEGRKVSGNCERHQSFVGSFFPPASSFFPPLFSCLADSENLFLPPITTTLFFVPPPSFCLRRRLQKK